ncbi:MAG: hypothetical protein JWP12_377 [Bacteroidetes bacterium]|nr:hypothetical protein [Bacteroidota bacterium]
MKLQKIIALASAALAFITVAPAQNLNLVQRGHLSYGTQTCANICGYVDSLGNEYALVGASVGLSIVDVTDPTTPTQVYQHVGPANAQSEWQEIKVRGKYAYVTTEAGGGLQIFNLSSLPDVSGITMHSWTGDGAATGLNTIHALHIDGHYVYLYGSNKFNGGALVADITDPWNPTYAGNYSVGTGSNQAYVHDGYVRNDTLYAGHIYSGYFSIVDFRNKNAPVELANQYTPSNFTHNTWLSTNSKILFTTDEVDNSFLTSYDISDVSNIIQLDKIQSNPGSQSIVHNTHIINVAGNDYAVTSWYRDGFTIVDAGRPNNLIQVGNYDTYPSGSGGGFNGDWGVYPFLPSGTIVVSNIEDGLYVFTPTYVRACYLEGAVTDSVCGVQLNNVHVTVTAMINDSTDISGQYRTGSAIPGTYSVTFSKSGYITKTITGVVLSPGIVNNLNVALVPFNTVALNGSTSDASSTLPLANAVVMINDATNAYSFVSDASGAFNSCNVVAATDYNITAGKWGYNTVCLSGQDINSAASTLSLPLVKGYYDDFSLNLGWTVSSTATTGMWVRGVPIETVNASAISNPGTDDSTDCGNIAYITGNGGGTASADDVDNGVTTLTSPVFDLTTYTNPYVDFSRWFYNAGGTGTPNDSLTVSISNGLTTVMLDVAVYNTPGNSSWIHKSFKVTDFIAPTATMKMIVRTEDNNPGHLVEAGFDKFVVSEGPTGIDEYAMNVPVISASPNPFTTETTIHYEIKNNMASNASMIVTDVTGRVVESIKLNQASGSVLLNTSINSGVYFVTIINGNQARIPVKIMKM